MDSVNLVPLNAVEEEMLTACRRYWKHRVSSTTICSPSRSRSMTRARSWMISRPARKPILRTASVRQQTAGKYSQLPRSRLTASSSPPISLRPVTFGAYSRRLDSSTRLLLSRP